MTDEQRLVFIFKQFAQVTQQLVDDLVEESTSLIANHPEWYEVYLEHEPSGVIQKFCTDGDELGTLLEESVPPLEDAATQIQSTGFDWWYLMDCLAEHVWQKVKKRMLEEERKEMTNAR